MNKDTLLALAIGTSLALACTTGYLWFDRGNATGADRAGTDPEVREAAIQRLIDASPGFGDSHIDPDVGRILKAGITDGTFRDHPLRTNFLGMRGPGFQPGPTDTLRIAFLGDSYVFGWGVAEEARIGAVLERLLAARGMEDVETLHIGVSSWNVHAATEFLRRQLPVVAPDIVVQIIVPNDLEDCTGVRGFGAPAHFSPRVRERTNALVSLSAQRFDWLLAKPHHTPLLNGLDHLSRSRYTEAGQAIAGLAEAVERSGARFLLLTQWSRGSGVVSRQVTQPLGAERTGFVPPEIFKDKDHWVAPNDEHWNERGHELMAHLTLARLIDDGWIDPPIPAEDPLGDELLEAARKREAWASRQPAPEPVKNGPLLGHLAFPRDEEIPKETIAQVYTGIDRSSHAAPFAALVLRRTGNELVLRVRGLENPGLATVTVSVQVEELSLGSFEVEADEFVLFQKPLPELLADREHVAVVLSADDYVYARDTIGRHSVERCVSYQIQSVEVR